MTPLSTRELQPEDLWGYAKRLRFVREAIRDSFGSRPGLRVLDIGCGNGSQLAIPLAHDARLKIVGIDTDARSIEHAQRLSNAKANPVFVCAPVTDISGEPPFDVVILSEVIEHLARPDEMLKSATRLLSRDGLLIVTVPNGYGEFEIDSWIFRLLRLQKIVDRFAKPSEVLAATDNFESGHIQFFTRRRLKRLFKDAGLVIFREGAASFLAGPVAGHFVARSQRVIDWNARITDRLPFLLASGWYFALRRREPNQIGAAK
jgi:2-polyprenyl-3-methyl-5-hydroxy-6-metoxy-1,4-benzoquinol methylase